MCEVLGAAAPTRASKHGCDISGVRGVVHLRFGLRKVARWRQPVAISLHPRREDAPVCRRVLHAKLAAAGTPDLRAVAHAGELAAPPAGTDSHVHVLPRSQLLAPLALLGGLFLAVCAARRDAGAGFVDPGSDMGLGCVRGHTPLAGIHALNGGNHPFAGGWVLEVHLVAELQEGLPALEEGHGVFRTAIAVAAVAVFGSDVAVVLVEWGFCVENLGQRIQRPDPRREVDATQRRRHSHDGLQHTDCLGCCVLAVLGTLQDIGGDGGGELSGTILVSSRRRLVLAPFALVAGSRFGAGAASVCVGFH